MLTVKTDRLCSEVIKSCSKYTDCYLCPKYIKGACSYRVDIAYYSEQSKKLKKEISEKHGWFYKTFLCFHDVTGQIKVEKHWGMKGKHYRFCEKCGKKFYVD